MSTEHTPPSVGRIVHYVFPGGPCMAAIVTAIPWEGCVSLQVFTPPSAIQQPAESTLFVRQDEGRVDQVSATWHWPERV